MHAIRIQWYRVYKEVTNNNCKLRAWENKQKRQNLIVYDTER